MDKKVKRWICFLLVLCIGSTAMLIVEKWEDNKRERWYVSQMMIYFNDVLVISESLLEEEMSEEDRTELTLSLANALGCVGRELEDGYKFISDKIPVDGVMWFFETASEVQNGKREAIEKVHTKIKGLTDGFFEETSESRTFRSNMSLKEFSEVIRRFYQQNSFE